MLYYCEDKETVLRETGSTPEGLSSAEAQNRLEKNGKNCLAEAPKDSLVKRFFAQMADPMAVFLGFIAVGRPFVIRWGGGDRFNVSYPIAIILMVFIWKYLVRPLGGAWNIYELLPAFLLACVVIVVVSLLTPAPGAQVVKEFEEVKELNRKVR